MPVFMYFDSKAAEYYYFEGTVVDIEWKSKNHQRPKFTILDDEGENIVISHQSIILDKSVIKVGDKISKVKGSSHCEINGNKILFEKSFWE